MFVALLAFDVWRIRQDLEAGQQAVTSLHLSTVDQQGGVGPAVAAAAEDLQRANRRARTSPWLRVMAPLPILGTQVAALRDLSAAAAAVGDAARGAAAEVQGQLDATSDGDPSARLQLLEVMGQQLVQVRAALDRVDPGADGWLVPPLAGAKDRLVDRLERADGHLDDGLTITRLLHEFLTGPSDYLVMAGNNAEMRGGGGMPLSVGVAHVEAGEVVTSEFQSSGPLFLGVGNGVGIPGELRALFPDWSIGEDIRETAVSPNFPVVAPIQAGIAERNGMGDVDGVIQVDAVALRVLLQAVGPVTLDGVTYDAGNVEQQVLNENYLRFETLDVRFQRYDLQSRLARAAFDALNTRSFSIAGLAGGLAEAARGRHVLAWSADDDQQRLWELLGADGALEPDGLMVNLENISANKLDWHLNPEVSIEVEDVGDGVTRMGVSVTLANLAREVQAPYVEGYGTSQVAPSDHRSMFALYLPETAYGVRTAAPEGFSNLGTDGEMNVAAIRYTTPLSESSTRRIDFFLPPGQRSLTLLPSGRVRPVAVEFRGQTLYDNVPVELEW